MKQIDAGPDDYRKQDPKTGRWMQNVDRKLCRWMALGGVAFLAIFAWHYRADGMVLPALFFGVMGVGIGIALTLSLRTID